jgi:uncharacterized membrane protein YeiH
VTTLLIAEIIGIVAFSISGFFVAVRAKLDILGILIASFLTALGGGIVRDIIAGKTPYTFSHNLPSLIVLCVVVLAILFKLHKRADFEKKSYFLISDTLGLVSFAISGAFVALEADFNFAGVILLSIITAIGGGVMRDILINQVPIVLVSEFYATVAILIGAFIYLLNYFDVLSIYGTIFVFGFGFLLRILAYYKKWHLPKLHI